MASQVRSKLWLWIQTLAQKFPLPLTCPAAERRISNKTKRAPCEQVCVGVNESNIHSLWIRVNFVLHLCHIYLISNQTSLPSPAFLLTTVCASPRFPPLNCLWHLNTAHERPLKLAGWVTYCDLLLICLYTVPGSLFSAFSRVEKCLRIRPRHAETQRRL